MKTIENIVNEHEIEQRNLEELKKVTDAFLNLYDRIDDSDKELVCIDFIRSTIKYSSNKDRIMKAWEYSAKEILYQ